MSLRNMQRTSVPDEQDPQGETFRNNELTPNFALGWDNDFFF